MASSNERLSKRFCKNNNLPLNLENFNKLLSDLLTCADGKAYDISDSKIKELFETFDKNKDGVLDDSEFENVSKHFIQPLTKPVTALLVIDVQYDFINGSLALKNCPAKQEACDVIPIINNLIDKYPFDVVVYTYDYHPEDHISFFENLKLYPLSEKNKPVDDIVYFDTVLFKGPPEMIQKLWPVHCVQNTKGSELHSELKVAKDSLAIYKGTNSAVDSYSAFFDNSKLTKTCLDEELKQRNVTHVFICGLAFDYCVSFTAIDAAELGYATVVIEDATRGTEENNILKMKEKLRSVNCVLADSCDIENLWNGKDIKPEFAFIKQSNLK